MNEIQLIEWKIVHSNKRFIYTWMNNNEQSSINDPVFRYVGFTIHFFFFIQFFSCSRSAFQNRLDWQIRNHLNEEVLSNNNTIFPIKNSILLMVRFLFFCVCFCFSTFWWQWCVLSTFTRANKKSTHKLSSLWRILMLFKKPWLNTINNFSICMNRKLRFIYIVEIKRRTSAAHWWIFVCVCFQNCASVLRSNRTHSDKRFWKNFIWIKRLCLCALCTPANHSWSFIQRIWFFFFLNFLHIQKLNTGYTGYWP